MAEDKRKQLWIIIGHPRQLAMALVLSKAFSHEFPCHLVISGHKYWNTINLDEYRAHFARITVFEPIYHTHSIKELIRAITAIFKAKTVIKRLPVQPQDVLISIEAWNYIENIMTTVWQKNKQIFLCPERITSLVSMTRREIYAKPNHYITKTGYVHYALDTLLGLKKKNYYYWIKGGQSRFDHALAYSKPVEELYHRVFILKSIFSKELKPNEIYYPYYTLRSAAHGGTRGNMVVFFTSGYITNTDYNQRMSTILQNLRKHYGEAYNLQVRLHPNQPASDKVWDCRGWHINREPGITQLFLTRHADEVAAVFSDKSTGQTFPLNMGFPTYSYHRAMGMQAYVVEHIDRTYHDAPKEFFLDSVDALPQPYEPAGGVLVKARSALEKIRDEIIDKSI